MKESKNIYSLPINKEDLISIKSDPTTHFGMDEFAIDFDVPENNVVRAAAAGKIIFIKIDSNSGGDNLKYEDFKFYNHIVIKHENGEYTKYGHLKYESTDKKVGDSVNIGDTIAASGNTGYSAGPHLHFAVFILEKMNNNFDKLPPNKNYFINDEDFGFKTIKPKFNEEIIIL